MNNIRTTAYVAAALLVLGLVCALFVSVAINLVQWRAAGRMKADAKAAAMEQALQTTADIARAAQSDNATLLDQLNAIAVRGQRVRVEYKTAAAAAPLPESCAPGADRVKAINEALGPVTGGRVP